MLGDLVTKVAMSPRPRRSNTPLWVGFGGLVHVQNKQREFLWVHEQFVAEYRPHLGPAVPQRRESPDGGVDRTHVCQIESVVRVATEDQAMAEGLPTQGVLRPLAGFPITLATQRTAPAVRGRGGTGQLKRKG